MDGRGDKKQEDVGTSAKVILCTTFPSYDWARELVGDSDAFRVELLVAGVDLHSYQPKAQDIVRISEADVLVYIGGESDTWVRSAVEQSGNEGLIEVNLLALAEDYALFEEDHEDDHDEEYDEHIWLSLENAEFLCGELAEIFAALDPENAEIYNTNYEAYQAKLQALDTSYRELVEQADYDTILIGDRFPFLYLMKEYGISYYAAYSGCSADAEASVHMVSYLAKKLEDLQLPAVFTVDGGKQDLAKTVIECAKLQESPVVLNLNSMQGITAEDIQSGVTYLSVMEENLRVLAVALRK